MTKVKEQRKKLDSGNAVKGKGPNMKFEKVADEVEKKLKRMGIELEQTGPLLQAPRYRDSRIY